MRIALSIGSSSSSAASETEQSEGEEELRSKAYAKAAVAPAQGYALSVPSLEHDEKEDGQGVLLSRASSYRQETKETQRRKSVYVGGRQPRWMRESTPKPFENADGDDQSVGSLTMLEYSSDDDSDVDSEEDQWPVAPRRFQRKVAQRSADSNRYERQASVEAQELSQRIRLANEADEQHGRRPRRVISKRINARRSITSSPTASKIPLGAVKTRADDDVAEVESLLASLQVKHAAEERKVQETFEQRNKALWSNIEASIREAEQVRAKAEQEEAEKQKRIKEQQEAAERRAREARQDEEKKAKEAREAEEQKKKQQEEESKAKAAADAARTAQEAKEKSLSASVGDGLVTGAREEYERWYAKIQSIKQNVLPAVSENKEWRKQCFGAKRIITRSIGQLTNSRAEIVRITKDIHDVLSQAKLAPSEGKIYTWILNHLSKCLIRQAEQETAAKQDTAFPLARVVVWLLLEGHAEFGDVLMARLAKKCCWCTAYCPPKKADQDAQSHAKQLGKVNAEESSLQYTSRMSGISAMYFAICQTKLSAPPTSRPVDAKLVPPHFRPSALWIWQARMIAPRMMEYSLVPVLYSVLIEVAGPVLLMAFGKQTRKLWTLLLNEGLRNAKAAFVKQESTSSARVRLEMLLDDWQKTGMVEGATQGREMEA